ncbi:sensor histidine kinase [Pseudonocardia alaniniphila]|uniref:histidine kinase n=1 Tax=Pseudonocardia alaniniphila TaxID=75291 RepID=A0ABS9T7E6_9PSEU|nr:histidine kinase [Pseudonocardia alaniniphila]MCH6164450.1 histidine kinase [Pseudonocardia alaniniphila]
MMLEPAQCAGDAPRTPSEQGTPDAPSSAAPPPTDPQAPDPATRLPTPDPDARRRAEREQWMRRRRLERQLHDGAALRISALALQLGLFRHRVPDAEPDLHASIDSLQDELHAALQELRDVAGKIYPSLLDDAGLGPALREAADRVDIPVRVDASADRFDPAAEGAAYFSVVECLAAMDAAAAAEKAAGGEPGEEPVEVAVRRVGDESDGWVLSVQLRGVNVAHAGAMLDQVRRLGGTIDVAGGPGPGTITARIPCE